MSKSTRENAGQQTQNSTQSGVQGEAKDGTGKTRAGEKARPGIGSSQGQDAEKRRPSAGTADLERGRGNTGDVERGGSGRDSLVQDPTGAYPERP